MVAKQIQYPGPGCIVEFLQGNAVLIAWVMEEQNGKLRLLLPNRREMNLPASRLLPWSGPAHPAGNSKDQAIALLMATGSRRIELRKQIRSAEIWEMIQGELDHASVGWLAELAFTELDVDRLAACGQTLLDDKVHFKFQPPDFEIYTAEQVQVREAAARASAEREALVDGGAEWFRLLWEARQNHRPEPDPDRQALEEPVLARLRNLLLARIVDPDTPDDAALWRQVSKGLPEDPHLPLLLAASWGLVDEHHNFWLDRAGYLPGNEWASPHQAEIQGLLKKLNEQSAPPLAIDFISIDSIQTKDVDDAFHLSALPDGGYDLHVALAAPALNWNFDSPLDRDVASRATSIYLPEANYHMLPEKLGIDAYSLLAGQIRPALILHMQFTPAGLLAKFAPSAGWVRLTANLGYPACEQIFDQEAKPDNPALPHARMLHLGLELAEKRKALRIAAKAVLIEKPDPEYYLVGQGRDTEVFLREPQPAASAQFLVSEMMIAANAGLAEWAVQNNLPLLYRTQDIAVPDGFAGCWTRPEDIARVVKIMVPASLDLDPKPHAGMGLKIYTTVSSPLRRYPDFLNEAQVLSWLQNGQARWTRAQLERKLTWLNVRLEAAGQVQRQRPRYWKFLYLQQQSRGHGEACRWEAVVCEVNDAFVSISLEKEQMLLRGKRSMFGEKIRPGQQIRVRLGKIHPLRGEAAILNWEENEQQERNPCLENRL